MSAVVIAIHNQARLHELLDQANVPSDVFAQSMGDLNNSPGTSAAIPPRASNGQSICARELETVRLDRYSTHGLSISWVTGWILERALRSAPERLQASSFHLQRFGCFLMSCHTGI